jgi:mRNA interferase MazF
MGSFARGDVVLFPFPYTDLSRRKLRPCLIISEKHGDDIILCQITSQQSRKDAYTIGVKKEACSSNLMIDSYVRCNMIFTAHKSQIVKKMGNIPDSIYRKVVVKITQMITKPT